VFFARIAAEHTGRAVEEELSALSQGRAARQPAANSVASQVKRESGASNARAAALEAVRVRVEQKFAGKLERARELGVRQGTLEALESASVAPSAHVAQEVLAAAARPAQETVEVAEPRRRALAERGEGARRGLNRNQRRVVVKHSGRELSRIARRYLGPAEEKGGVWSKEDFRRIRACVQDASGRAAACILYQLGSREAVTLAEDLDPRVPMDRRRIAFAYAVARAPASELGETIKLGFAMGLWSAVLADPNNPNMERRRQFRPSRRTLSSDLSWLQERKVLKRWQVRIEHAAPCEIKRNPNYPTNRYYAPVRRDGSSMMSIALALGDVPPEVRPNPAEHWSEEDAEALREAREVLLGALDVAKLPSGPPS
jgi:hypothetical protein